MIYDAAIIGTGPAGLSAAINLRLHNKSIIWFGSKELSDKVGKSEKIANYPGFLPINGEELNSKFHAQIEEWGLEITEKMVTNITSSRRCYMLLADNEIYEAKTILLATGTAPVKGIEGEDELLGHGVSYCATCDGFLYPGKTIAIWCAAKRFEHEVKYLSEIAEKVYLFASYPDCEINIQNVEHLMHPIKKVCGEKHVERIELADGSTIDVQGLFFMRNSVTPTALLRGLAMDGNHIAVDRRQATNLAGCFAAGDCTGRPYQIAKAVGEGNIAAHGMIEYLSGK